MDTSPRHLTHATPTGSTALALVKHPRIAILIVAVLSCVGLLSLAKLQLDPATERIFPEGHPALEDFERFRSLFGNDEFIVVAYESPQNIISRDELARLQALTRAIEDVELSYGDPTSSGKARPVTAVRSLTNVPSLTRVALVPKLEKLFPKPIADMTSFELAAAARVLRTAPFTTPLLLSRDGKATSLVVEFSLPEGSSSERETVLFALVTAIEEEARAQLGPSGLEPQLAGSPVIKRAIVRALVRDVLLFTAPLLFLAVLISGLIFRSIPGVVIPLAVITSTALILLGAMVMAGIPMRPMTSLLPPLMLVVSIADSIHVLAELQHTRSRHPEWAPPQVAQAAIGTVFAPCALTSLTTAIGFASLYASDIAPVREFGVLAACGALLALATTFLLVPNIWLSLPAKPGSAAQRSPRVEKLADYALRHHRLLSILMLGIGALSLFGVGSLSFDTDYVGFFKHDSKIRKAGRFIEERFAGIGAIEIIVECPPQGDLRETERLALLLAFERDLMALEEVDLALSAADVVAFIHSRQSGREELPTRAQMRLMEHVFKSLSGQQAELGRSVSPDFRVARVSTRVRAMGSEQLLMLLNRIDAIAAERFRASDGWRVTVTGTPVIFSKTSRFMLLGQLNSFYWALAIITVVMTLALRSLRLGLISVIPNVFPIAVTFGVMSLCDIALNSFNTMVASVAIGIAVDDTIHMLVGFQRFRRLHDARDALRQTLAHTGAAVLATSAMLVAGFLVLTFGSFAPTAHFGFLTAVAIIAALLGDLFLLPALVLLDARLFDRAPEASAKVEALPTDGETR